MGVWFLHVIGRPINHLVWRPSSPEHQLGVDRPHPQITASTARGWNVHSATWSKGARRALTLSREHATICAERQQCDNKPKNQRTHHAKLQVKAKQSLFKKFELAAMNLVAPDVSFALESALSKFPFRLGRQAFSSAFRVGSCIVPRNLR